MERFGFGQEGLHQCARPTCCCRQGNAQLSAERSRVRHLRTRGRLDVPIGELRDEFRQLFCQAVFETPGLTFLFLHSSHLHCDLLTAHGREGKLKRELQVRTYEVKVHETGDWYL